MMYEKRTSVDLPVDRYGTPIDVGDLLEFEKGGMARVAALTLCSDGEWLADDEDGELTSDNLSRSVVIVGHTALAEENRQLREQVGKLQREIAGLRLQSASGGRMLL